MIFLYVFIWVMCGYISWGILEGQMQYMFPINNFHILNINSMAILSFYLLIGPFSLIAVIIIILRETGFNKPHWIWSVIKEQERQAFLKKLES